MSSMRWPGNAARHRLTGTTTSPRMTRSNSRRRAWFSRTVPLMTFSIGTTPALASPLATASNTSRKLPSDARSTSPNAARTASSANAPGSPAYAMGTGSPLAGTRWRRVCVADRVIRRDDLTDNGLDGRLHRGFGIGGRRVRWQPGDGRIELGLRRLKRVELGADERARDGLQRDEVSLRLRRSLLVVVARRCRRQRLDCRKR